MLGHTFYHGLIRKYVVLFGTLFNDLQIVRPDTAHNTVHSIDVPISYGPREKVLARLEQDSTQTMPAIQLPRMTFELSSFSYDADRKLSPLNRHTAASGNEAKFQYVPVPYNFQFSLSIMTKNVDDAWRIVEQILPFFTPDFTMRATLIEEMEEVRDIPVILDMTNLTDLYEGTFEERRVLTVELGFTLKAFLFGPIRTSSPLITQANTNFFNLDSNTRVETISWTPGQTANGQPTSNAALSINRNSIAPNSDYGFIMTSNTA